MWRFLRHKIKFGSALSAMLFCIFCAIPVHALTVDDLTAELSKLATDTQTLQTDIQNAKNDPLTTTAQLDALTTQVTTISSRVTAIRGLLVAAPSAPKVQASTGSSCGGNVTLSYTAPTNGTVLTYELNRNPDLNQLPQWGVVAVATDIKKLPADNNGLKPDTPYQYQLRAVGDGEVSASSLTVSVNSSEICPASAPAVSPQVVANADATVFDKPGAYTWKVPDNVTKIQVEVWGAGGAGGYNDYNYMDPGIPAGGGGGGGGGYGKDIFSVTPGDSYAVIVGRGGRPFQLSPLGLNGEPGGSSSVGALISASGGLGGLGGCADKLSVSCKQNANHGGAGGTSLASSKIAGTAGSKGGLSGGTDIYSGNGGSGGNGGTGGKGVTGHIGGQKGQAPGGGGGGYFYDINNTGGSTGDNNGGDGRVVITVVEKLPQNDLLPVGAKTSASCGGKIDLSWTKVTGAAAGNVAGYIIYRFDYDARAEFRDPPIYVTIKISDINTTAYVDTTPATNTSYWYYVLPATADELATGSPDASNAAAVILAQASVSRGYSGSQIFRTFGATTGTAEPNFATSSNACPSPSRNPDLTSAPNTPTASDGEADATWTDTSVTPNIAYFTPGKKVNVNGAALNIGQGPVPAGRHFNGRFQKSESQVFDPTNVAVIDLVAPAGGLLKNATLPVSYTYASVPSDNNKTYYFRYCVDQPPYENDDNFSGLIDERQSDGSGEGNNCSGGVAVKFKTKPIDAPTCDCAAVNSSLVVPGQGAAIADSVIGATKNINADDASVIKIVWSSTGADSVTLFKTLPDGTIVGGNLIVGNVGSGEITLPKLTVGVYDYVFTAKNAGGECISKVRFNIVAAPPPPVLRADLVPWNTSRNAPQPTAPAVSGQRDDDNNLISGKPYTLVGTVKNIGTKDSTRFNIKFQYKLEGQAERFYKDLPGTTSLSGLVAGVVSTTRPAPFSSNAASNDTYNFRYCVDMPPNDYLGFVDEKQSAYTDVNNNPDITASPPVGEYNNCSGEATAVFKPPTGTLSCTANNSSRITLNWTEANGTNVSLFRGNQFLQTFSAPAGSYPDSGLTAGSSYTYYLRNGNTTNALELARATCTPPVPPPLPSVGTISCVANSASQITLTWSQTRAADLSILRNNTVVPAFTASNPAIDTGLSAGISYTYAIRDGNRTLARATCTTLPPPVDTCPPTCSETPTDLIPVGVPGINGQRNDDNSLISGQSYTLTGRVKNLGGTNAGGFAVKFQAKLSGQEDRFYQDLPDTASVAGLSGGTVITTVPTTFDSNPSEVNTYTFRFCADMPPNDYLGVVNEKQSAYTDVNNNADKTAGVGEYNNCSGEVNATFSPAPIVSAAPPLSVTCGVSPNAVDMAANQPVTWQAFPSGGNGSYSYKWTGNDQTLTTEPTRFQQVITFRYDPAITEREFKWGSVEVTDSAGQVAFTPDPGCTNGVLVSNSNDDYALSVTPLATLTFVGQSAVSNRVGITIAPINGGRFNSPVTISPSPDSFGGVFLSYAFYKHGDSVPILPPVVITSLEYAAGLDMVVKAPKFIQPGHYPAAITVHSTGGPTGGVKTHDKTVDLDVNDSRPKFQEF